MHGGGAPNSPVSVILLMCCAVLFVIVIVGLVIVFVVVVSCWILIAFDKKLSRKTHTAHVLHCGLTLLLFFC